MRMDVWLACVWTRSQQTVLFPAQTNAAKTKRSRSQALFLPKTKCVAIFKQKSGIKERSIGTFVFAQVDHLVRRSASTNENAKWRTRRLFCHLIASCRRRHRHAHQSCRSNSDNERRASSRLSKRLIAPTCSQPPCADRFDTRAPSAKNYYSKSRSEIAALAKRRLLPAAGGNVDERRFQTQMNKRRRAWRRRQTAARRLLTRQQRDDGDDDGGGGGGGYKRRRVNSRRRRQRRWRRRRRRRALALQQRRRQRAPTDRPMRLAVALQNSQLQPTRR